VTRLLLDTQVLLWLGNKSRSLRPDALAAIRSANNDRLVSMASVWEIAIKLRTGKLDASEAFYADPIGALRQTMQAALMEIMPITLEHTGLIARLPLRHGDPFDRMLVAQSISDNLTLVSSDAKLSAYREDGLSLLAA
jgi:PIN domain nuclease of toxin-antitoxin system